MKLTVNGQPAEIAEPMSVAEFLAQRGLAQAGRRVAVEVNGQVVPRRELEAVRLKEGDRMEVVTLVGGG